MLEKGDYVTYLPYPTSEDRFKERGRVKSVQNDEYCFVVFNCNEDWDNYEEYTGQRTHVSKLIKESK